MDQVAPQKIGHRLFCNKRLRKTTGLTVHRENFKGFLHSSNEEVKEARSSYFSNFMNHNRSDPLHQHALIKCQSSLLVNRCLKRAVDFP